MFFKIVVSKNFANFKGKDLCQNLFNNVADHQNYNFIQKKLRHGCFPVKLAESLTISHIRDTGVPQV